MSGKSLRLRLPAGPSSRDLQGSADNAPCTGQLEHRSRKRPRFNACDGCRNRKCRCDGSRPSCKTCLRLQLQCVYDADIRGETTDAQQSRHEILHVLRTAPEAEALGLLRRLRASRSPLFALASLQGSMSRQYQPSAIQTARSESPPTSSALEFELSARHSLLYPRVLPIDTTKIKLAPLTPSAGATYGPTGLLLPSQTSRADSMAESYCDARLEELDITHWTTVAIENRTASRIISTYLQSNHPVWGFFHADLFVRDLVTKGIDFCSPFLVNALLLYACQTYGAIDPQVPSFKGPFARATELLWRAERPKDSVLNLAAILMFSLSCHTTDCGVSLAELLGDGRRMAERLELFGEPDTSEVLSSFSNLSDDWKRATAHVAWGSYGWMTINMNYTSVMTPIDFPPPFPIPGSSIKNPETNEPGVQWVTDQLPSYYGKTFTSLCGLWVILQEIGTVCRRGEDSDDIPPAFVEKKFQQLLHWADHLGERMAPDDRNPDPVIVFHMFFHCAVLDLFLPFYNSQRLQRLSSFYSHDTSPQAICRASINQLKHLLTVCRASRHLVLTSTSTAAIVHLCHAMIRDGSIVHSQKLHTSTPGTSNELDGNDTDTPEPALFVDQDWHFYFLLCVTSCQDMLLCFDLAAPLLRGLLTMALRDGALRAPEARALIARLESRAMIHSAEALYCDFGDVILDLGLALTAPEEAQTRNLSEMFEALLTFQEFTQNDDFIG
ncbi:Nitrogen assimilation transcription factor nirA 1 [Colletotrichum chlorophyti]|uniref:Nitrogen assimilation transcription factor nirA 1 n=1 Tax=Colletotrichum chlorophyti TaxID=708187 RepID=A0A1Q8RQZ9_9PEZI|nr:Nitrogen assimilation transcription factor nirA 1 [Colletotrichum chlorophyti]